MFKNLTLTQKAMVLGYRHGYVIPFLERQVQLLHKKRAKVAVQQKYMERQKELIGDEKARRAYWIARLKLSY